MRRTKQIPDWFKRSLCLVCVLCMVGVFSGCNLLQSLFYTPYERQTVPFSEMAYARPDFDGYQKKIQQATEAIEQNRGSYQQQLDGINALNEGYWDYQTMYALAELKYALNTADSFYYDECTFYGKTSPELRQAFEALYVACSRSAHKDKFEEDYFGEGFLDQYQKGGTLSQEVVQLLQQEASLTLSYQEQMANATVNYFGQNRSLAEWLQTVTATEERSKIIDAYITQSNQTCSQIYADLVKVRLQIARAQGYSSYAEYAYQALSRDYTAEMGATFVETVAAKLVPLYQQVASQSPVNQRLPGLSDQQTPEIVIKALRKMHPEIGDAASFMVQYALYDIAPSAHKVDYNFTTYLSNYDAPFIAVNPTETQLDVLTFSHEFGHFLDMYMNYNTNDVLDQSESASQAMEYLILQYLPDSESALQETLTTYKMYESLAIYIEQSAYTAFEQQVYALPLEEVSAQRINAIAKQVQAQFGLAQGDTAFDRSWVFVSHFYEQAFYCISYCVSNGVAMQLYQAECADSGSGVQTYMEMLDWDPEKDFLENMERAGLRNPLDQSFLEETAVFLTQALTAAPSAQAA